MSSWKTVSKGTAVFVAGALTLGCGGKVFLDGEAGNAGAGAAGGGSSSSSASSGGGAGGGSSSSAASSSSSASSSSASSASSSSGAVSETEAICQCLEGIKIKIKDPTSPGGAESFGNECLGCQKYMMGANYSGYDVSDRPCNPEWVACMSTPGCLDIWLTLSSDDYEAGKLAGDILPLDADAAHLAFGAAVQCMCPLCTDTCIYTDPIPSCH